MFFPNGTSSYGDLSSMKVGLGNYDQKMITAFTDTNGTKCSYAEYLRNRGLYASRTYVYSMTTGNVEENTTSIDIGPSNSDGTVAEAEQSSAAAIVAPNVDVSNAPLE